MKRLVYSPSVKVWIKSDTGTIDLSPYIVSCRIDRKIDDVSMAEIEFRNPRVSDNGKPRFMFTEHDVDGKILPVFHPMDPITITMERIAGKPIQVFTGYCDSTPDVQLFPGTAKITASCTLKRLKYTYWDPALPFISEFLKKYGWEVDVSSGQVQKHNAIELDSQKLSKSVNFNDGSIASLLYAVLNEIGGWDDSNIYIQPLPTNIVPIIYKLFDEFTDENKRLNKEVIKFFGDLVGKGSFGTAAAGAGADSATGGNGTAQPSQGGTGWVTVEASWFDDPPPGASGKLGNAPGGVMNYAELGTATTAGATGSGYMAKAFGLNGELPFYTKVEVRYKGKSIIASKTDRGWGNGGSRRAIDLWTDAADALGIKNAGIADVEIRLVN